MEYCSEPISPTLHYSNTPVLQSIEPPRIFIQNLLPQLRRQVLANVERIDELVFARRIVMRIVRTDQQRILPHAAGEIGNIFVGFAGNVQAVFLEQIGAGAEAKLVLEQPTHDMQ